MCGWIPCLHIWCHCLFWWCTVHVLAGPRRRRHSLMFVVLLPSLEGGLRKAFLVLQPPPFLSSFHLPHQPKQHQQQTIHHLPVPPNKRPPEDPEGRNYRTHRSQSASHPCFIIRQTLAQVSVTTHGFDDFTPQVFNQIPQNHSQSVDHAHQLFLSSHI